MKKPSYGWLLKWILAAILIGIGFTFFFEEKLVFLIVGIAITIFSLFRVYPLLKSLNKETLRTINLIEIVLSTLIGVMLIYVGIKALNNELELDGIWGHVFKYSLVFVFAARSIVYLYSVTFLEEKTEQVKFWTHIGLLVIATVVATKNDFDAKWVGMLLLVISLIGGAYLVYDGYGGYGKYRKYQLEINKEKAAKKELEESIVDKKEEVVIIEDKDDDRPLVN